MCKLQTSKKNQTKNQNKVNTVLLYFYKASFFFLNNLFLISKRKPPFYSSHDLDGKEAACNAGDLG